MKIVSPAILTPNRSRLGFPTGNRAGYDPSHIFSRGLQLSAVSNGLNFINLLPGNCPLLGTTHGTMASVYDKDMGLVKTVGTTSYVSFAGAASANFSPVTLAAIFSTNSDNSGIIHNATAATNGPMLANFGNNHLWFSVPAGDIDSGLTITNNVPYFGVASYFGTNTDNVPLNFVLVNLLSGQISTATTIISLRNAITGSGYSIGFEWKYSDYWQGRIGAVYAAAEYHTMAALVKVAQFPWKIWYPQRANLYNRVGVSGAPVVPDQLFDAQVIVMM